MCTEWHFRLDGEEFDLNGVSELFGSEVKIIKDENNRTQLVMDLPFSTEESRAAQEAAEKLLARLNAIAQIVHRNHNNLRIGAAGCKDPSGGPLHQFIHMGAAIRSGARVSASANVFNSSGEDITASAVKVGDILLLAADNDEHLKRALFLFGSLQHDWRGLYMVLDAAKDSCGKNWADLKKKGWVPSGQIDDFKATANSFKAIQADARHGTVAEGVDQARQTLPEAREMVRTLLERSGRKK